METLNNGVYKLVSAMGMEYLFLDADSKLEDVIGFARRFNKVCKLEKKFVYLKCKEGTIAINDELGVC